MSATSTPPLMGALPPPPGITPNFIDPYSIEEGLKAVLILLVVLTTLSTAIRLHTKFLIIKTHGWEDCKLKKKNFLTGNKHCLVARKLYLLKKKI